jgi:hypothetical protein
MQQPVKAPESGMPASGETPPAHGFQGDRGAVPPPRTGPAALSIALSREAGARGGSIARRTARKLGWQVYDQDLLEYMAQDAVVRQGLLENLPRSVAEWAEGRLRQLWPEDHLGQHALVVNLARVVLALGAAGEVVLIGRGAGCILPRQTTLNVRVVAPREERIAYMGQWLRLTEAEAAERVRSRDERRNEFLAAHFQRSAGDVHLYDVTLNSSLLGEEVCAELIAHAARARAAQLAGEAG